MKNINILRGNDAARAAYPSQDKNVQEIQPVNKATVSVTSDLSDADRPHVLSKRSARWARRNAH